MNDVEDKLLELTEEIKRCTACHLSRGRTNVVPGIYGPKNGICFIGEAPGFFEDKQGLPFVGRSGKLLDNMLKEIGLTRRSVSILNVVKCRPTTSDGKNRTPTEHELKFCGERWLFKQLELIKPKLIVTLGGIALKFFFPKLSVTKTVGKVLKTKEGYKIFVTYHPAFILRNYNLLETYEKHFKEINEIIRAKTNRIATKGIEEKKSEKTQKSLMDFLI